jgi:hypothetical protein
MVAGAAKIAEKRARLIEYQLTIAKLPLAKDINDFDFAGTPINETLIRDLAGGAFLAEQRNPMSNAERQARYRAARAVARPVIQYRSAGDHRSRVRRWHDAVAVLLALQAEYRAWLQALPDSLQEGATAEALQAIDDLDELRRSNRLGASVAISRPPLGLPRWANSLLFATGTTPQRRKGGPFCTPIRGPFCTPIDTRGLQYFRHRRPISSISGSRVPHGQPEHTRN